jgi:hypothetical protein
MQLPFHQIISSPGKRTLPRALAAIILCAACYGRAERLFVALVETDNYMSAVYGISAFTRSAELPADPDLVKERFASVLALPSFEGVSPRDPLRVVQTVDLSMPISVENPCNVALVPLADSGLTAQDFFKDTYASSTPLQNATLFKNPTVTNIAPQVAAVIYGKHLMVSRSPDALAWAWDNRVSLIGAPSQTSGITFRALVNPQRIADLSGKYTAFVAPVFNADSFLKDFERLSIDVNVDSQALTATLRGTPKPDTPLDKLAGVRMLPDGALWNTIRDNVFFAYVAASGPEMNWHAYRGNADLPVINPARSMLPPQAFSSDRALYLAISESRRGLCLVQIEPVKDRDAVKQAIKKLHTVSRKDGIVLQHGTPRQSDGSKIETYTISVSPTPPKNNTNVVHSASMLNTILALFLKQAVLETALVNDNLITVIGSPNSFNRKLAADLFAAKPIQLHRMLQTQSRSLSADDMAVAGQLKASALLRHVVTMVPDIKPEQVRNFPAGGDGAFAGLCIGQQRDIKATVRFSANEISALQRANRDGRKLLQDMLFQIFARQMMVTPQP